MNRVKINYLDTFVPNMSCGTGYSEPDLFQVICDDGTAKVVDIDIWYRTEDSAIAEFYSTMRTEFSNCDNLEEALEMWKTTLQSTDRCPYFWMNEKDKSRNIRNSRLRN